MPITVNKRIVEGFAPAGTVIEYWARNESGASRELITTRRLEARALPDAENPGKFKYSFEVEVLTGGETVRYQFRISPNRSIIDLFIADGAAISLDELIRAAGLPVSPSLESYVNEKITEAIGEIPTVPTGGTINDYFRGDGTFADLETAVNSVVDTANFFDVINDDSDDIEEGVNNLFFTDQRAIDAVDLSAYALTANISAVGFSNNYNDLDNLPNLFSGNYNDLSNLPNLALKANLDSPAFTGTPTAPTPINSTNTTQLATTEFVKNLIADLIDSAPGTLDSLNELAAALGDNPNFATDTANALALKLSKASNLADLQDAGAARTNLGLATVAATGDYADLDNLPALFSGNYNDLSNLPALFSGNYNDLSNKPTLFSGSYSDLSNKPTLNTFLPSQTGNSGKYLTTNGANASWETVAGGASSPLVLTANLTTETPLKIQGIASQTANLFEVENSSGTDLFAIEPSGRNRSKKLSVEDGLYFDSGAGVDTQWIRRNGNSVEIAALGNIVFNGYTSFMYGIVVPSYAAADGSPVSIYSRTNYLNTTNDVCIIATGNGGPDRILAVKGNGVHVEHGSLYLKDGTVKQVKFDTASGGKKFLYVDE